MLGVRRATSDVCGAWRVRVTFDVGERVREHAAREGAVLHVDQQRHRLAGSRSHEEVCPLQQHLVTAAFNSCCCCCRGPKRFSSSSRKNEMKKKTHGVVRSATTRGCPACR